MFLHKNKFKWRLKKIEKIEYDEYGRVIYEEHPDGFWENTKYIGNLKVVETHYSNGIIETERFIISA